MTSHLVSNLNIKISLEVLMIDLSILQEKLLKTRSKPKNLVHSPDLVSLLIDLAKKQPNKIAYRFLEDGETESDVITYKQ